MPRKKYDTPNRSRVVKTRMTEEEYADFSARLAPHSISQSEFIRRAIQGASIRPVVTVSPANDELLAALEQNALRSENTLTSNDGIPLDRTLSSNDGASRSHTPKQTAPQAPSIGRMVDREAKRAEGKGIGYDRWASIHNIKAWSKTLMYLQEHDLLSPDKLSTAVDAVGAEAREARSRYDVAAAKARTQP